MLMFSIIGVKESDVAKVMVILEALRLFSRTFRYKLIVESEKWVFSFQLKAMEISVSS